ncbi:MAG: DUF3795 domain-containing protein [bacterium]
MLKTTKTDSLIIKHPEIGVCGLSCRLCPRYQSESKSKCFGCKTDSRMDAGCPFITCAVKRKGIEFCRECEENKSCEKWKKHRESGRNHDSFKCYQTLERDIAAIELHGLAAFEKNQKEREKLLKRMMSEFNDGRSMSYYCIAATVLEIAELRAALAKAKKNSAGLQTKEKSKALHSLIDEIAARKSYILKLRK